MQVEIVRHALDRVPLSIIFDDSTVLLNVNYFWMRDRNPVDGENRRWEDVPVVHPESFVREFAQFCLDEGVKGKFSIVPVPAALGRVDHGLPLFSKQQQDSWIAMCRELIVPNYDITPEMLTHTFVVDPDTLKPIESGEWEQYEWQKLPDDLELIVKYLRKACEILVNIGMPPEGVTSPGGFGGHSMELYAEATGIAVREATGNPTPYFFKRVNGRGDVPTPVWYPDKERGEAVGEIIASTGDWTGSWTGYGEVNADKYITADLLGGRMVETIDMGEPTVMISHWQGFYGIHNEDRAGFNAFKTVVHRLKERDPRGERTRWRTCSEITNYAVQNEMATVSTDGDTISLDLPVTAPELTLRVVGNEVRGVTVDGAPLKKVTARALFEAGTFLTENGSTLLAFNPTQRQTTVRVQSGVVR